MNASTNTSNLNTLELWLKNKAFPLWAKEGFDAKNNFFIERLTLDEKADNTADRRLMVQARQIFSFAKAHEFNLIEGAKDIVTNATDCMIRSYYKADGNDGWIFSVKGEANEIVDTKRDLYAHAFVLLALSQVYTLTGSQHYLDIADETLAFIDTHFADGTGTYLTEPTIKDTRNQNPHMHLFEGILALANATNNAKYKQRAVKLFNLLNPRLFKKDPAIVIEMFNNAWQQLPCEEGTMIMHGHSYEWVWLIYEYQRITGEHVDESISDNLLNTALDAFNKAKQDVYIEMQEDGRIHKHIYRLWPYTEAYKALSVQKNADFKKYADVFIHKMFQNFKFNEFNGGWIDRITPQGEKQSDFIPASSLYHIVCGFSEYKKNAHKKAIKG